MLGAVFAGPPADLIVRLLLALVQLVIERGLKRAATRRFF